MKARAVQSLLEDLGKSARILKMTPYMARHTFAKNLVNSGVSLEKVAMLLGHTSLDTTMVYTTHGSVTLIRQFEHWIYRNRIKIRGFSIWGVYKISNYYLVF